MSGDNSLSDSAAGLIANPSNSIYVSAISLWEVAIKLQLGKLRGDITAIDASIREADFEPLPFRADDAVEVSKLPPLHRDPFDRALLAQARCQGLRLLTADRHVIAYGDPALSVDAI
jgi:PIN domain nuclease of toxin-antitoxin system